MSRIRAVHQVVRLAPGEETTVAIEWHDENHVQHTTVIRAVMLNQDDPRTCQVWINGTRTYTETPDGAYADSYTLTRPRRPKA